MPKNNDHIKHMDGSCFKVLNHNFQLEPQNLSLPANSMAIFHCSAPRGVPSPRIYWKKDEQIVRAGFGRVQQLTNGSLIVNEVRKIDEGRFVCVAENMLGIRESAPATLTVYVKPNFVQSPEDVTAKLGDRIRFQCIVDGDPRPIVHWRRENGQMPGNRVEIDPTDNSLIINNVEQSDDGLYFCEASNLIGNNSAAASLTVHSAPIFQIVPTDITASLNGVAKLPCAVSGNPQPNLFWSREGNQALLFPGNSNGRFTVTPSGHLTITDLQVEDSGFYVCSAISVVGSAMAKAHIKVTSAFEGSPPVIRFGPANQTLPTETIALIFCEVMQPNVADELTGQPIQRVVVNWLKNGKPILGTDRRFVQLDSGTLQINSLQTNDSGTYACVASYTDDKINNHQSKVSSDLPSTSWSATLTVESPRNPNIAFHRQPEFSSYPSAPFKPVIINSSLSEVTISWRKVQEIGSSPLIGYRLEYYDADSPKPSWQLASNRIFTEIYTVKHLQPNTRYVFQVRAENSHGLSAPSPFSNVVQTLKFASNRLNPQSINSQKDLDDIRLHLNNIQVILKEAKPMSANSVKLIWELVHRDQNVLVNKENIEGYYIRFRDVGPDLDELQNDLKLLNKPSPLKMTSNEHQKYNMLTVLTSGSNVNSYVISDLSEFTLYELFVVPFYKAVDGPPSNSRLVRTMADLPSAPPAEVKAHLINLTSISVHWKPVPKPQRNGIIQSYNVMLMPIQLANSTASQAINYNNMNVFSQPMHNSPQQPPIHLFNHQLQTVDSIPAPHYMDTILPSATGYGNQLSDHHPFDSTGNLYQHARNSIHSSSMFQSPMDYQDNNDLSSAALLSRNNGAMFNGNMPSSNEAASIHLNSPSFAHQQANPMILNQLGRNITTNANTHQLTIVGLQPGAIYQLRISAANMIGYGPASAPILLQMNAEYIIEADHEDLDASNSDQTTKRLNSSSSFNRNLFNSKIMTIIFAVCLTCLLLATVCFVYNRRKQNVNKFAKSNGVSVLSKNSKFPFSSSSTKNSGKLANDLFSNNPMISSAADSLTSPTDALWIDRNWLVATQNSHGSQTADYPLLKASDPQSLLIGGLNGSRTDHLSTSSAIYASTSQLNCSRPSLNNNASNGEYCALQSQNDYAEVSELGGIFANSSGVASKFDTQHSKNSAQSAMQGHALNNIPSSKLSSNGVLMPLNSYATTTLINLNSQNNNGGVIVNRVNLPDSNSIKENQTDYQGYNADNDFHCQGSMLYEHNSSIEPTSSTLLLQRTPSESGSYTTDEYSYRRNNGGKQQQLKIHTIERNKKNSKKNGSNNYNGGGTLCSKSSTASSHISEHSKASTIHQQQMSNKSNMFLLSELSGNGQDNHQDNHSPPSPAPPQFQNQISSQRIFTTALAANSQQPNNNYNLYESAYDNNSLYGGINRVQLGNRQHHTLNTRQLSNQQQRKNQMTGQRPMHNRVLDFIELNNDISGNSNNNHPVNLISNPLHHNSSLQGSMPSLVNGAPDLKNQQQNDQALMNAKVLLNNNNNKLPQNRAQHRPQQSNFVHNSQLNRSSSSLASESDNFYCDIEEAQRVQSDFRAKLNQTKQMKNRYRNDSGDENGQDDLVNENDKLISGSMNRDENKLIIRNRRLQDDEDEEDELLTDQYSDYECIDNLQTNQRFDRQNDYLRAQLNAPITGFNKPFNNNFNTTTASYNQRFTPANLSTTNNNPSTSSLNDMKSRQQFNMSLARKNQMKNGNPASQSQFDNSQAGLFRFKDNGGSFSTMDASLNNRLR